MLDFHMANPGLTLATSSDPRNPQGVIPGPLGTVGYGSKKKKKEQIIKNTVVIFLFPSDIPGVLCHW